MMTTLFSTFARTVYIVLIAMTALACGEKSDQQKIVSDARLQSARTNSAAEFRELYDRALALQHSREALESALQTQNGLPVLDKSLEAGQITLVEYFDQIETFYRSRETLLELDRDYQSTLARIFRFEL